MRSFLRFWAAAAMAPLLGFALCAPSCAVAKDQKKGGAYEEHYESVPADVDPSSAAPAGSDGRLDPDADVAPPPRGAEVEPAGKSKPRLDAKTETEPAAPARRSERKSDPVPAAADAGDDIADVAYFRQALNEGGAWRPHPRYGEVWRPEVDESWRPYTLGRWVYADDYGWTWLSDEPFGWATYHYGRWAFDEKDGWLWVPGTQWAPSWVAWRAGEEAIGWAPLPPSARFDKGRVDLDPAALEGERYSRTWVFVRPRYFARSEMQRFLRPEHWNGDLIVRTVPHLAFERTDRAIANRGLTPDNVERLAGRPLERVKVTLSGDTRLRSRTARADDAPDRDARIYRPERRQTEEVVRKAQRDTGRETGRDTGKGDESTSERRSRKAGGEKRDATPASEPASEKEPAAGAAAESKSEPRSGVKIEEKAERAAAPATGKASGSSASPGIAAKTPEDAGTFASDRKDASKASKDQAKEPAGKARGDTAPGDQTGSLAPRPAAGTKRWDGNGPSGAPADAAAPPQ